jgi:DNA (cytosine-5)-methyltransferase 1
MAESASDGQQQGVATTEATRHGREFAAEDGATNFWHEHEWLACHDGKARRTQPGLRLLVDGVPGRIHQWRIAGNSIVIPQAVEVLKALKEVMIEDFGWVANDA